MTNEEKKVRQRSASALWRARHPEKARESAALSRRRRIEADPGYDRRQNAKRSTVPGYKEKRASERKRNRIFAAGREAECRLKRTLLNKKIVSAIKLSGCSQCGATDNLEFNHRNPEEKRFNISEAVKKSIKTLLLELAKCDVLCRSCHRKVTSGQYAARREQQAMEILYG